MFSFASITENRGLILVLIKLNVQKQTLIYFLIYFQIIQNISIRRIPTNHVYICSFLEMHKTFTYDKSVDAQKQDLCLLPTRKRLSKYHHRDHKSSGNQPMNVVVIHELHLESTRNILSFFSFES